jgi:hypothetical protein
LFVFLSLCTVDGCEPARQAPDTATAFDVELSPVDGCDEYPPLRLGEHQSRLQHGRVAQQ